MSSSTAVVLPAGHALLLGSPDSAMPVFEAAQQRLRTAFQVVAESPCVRHASVIPGDPQHYLNRIFLVSDEPSSTTGWHNRLKQLEHDLGRRPGQAPPVVDVDLLCRYGAGGQVHWLDQEKMRHPLFRDLLASVLPGLARAGTGRS